MIHPLEALKEKLKVKPMVEGRREIKLLLSAPKVEPVQIKTTIVDKREEGYDPTDFLKRLQQNKLSKVTAKQEIQKLIVPDKAPIIKEPPKKRVKKQKQVLTILEEEVPLTIEEMEEPIKNKRETVVERSVPLVEQSVPVVEQSVPVVEQSVPLVEQITHLLEMEPPPITVAPKKGRRTPKLEKGVVEIGAMPMVQIGDTLLSKRIPPPPKIDMKVSSYFMNNREVFVNFINDLFSDYKDDLLDETKNITCDDIGKDTGEVTLLTHQKIVRDYINLYSPYRGLLLYHGLGSGKTCSSIAIAEGLKNTTKVIIMTPASLRRNYLEEIKKCGDLLYRKNQYWEWVSVLENPETVDPLSFVLGLPREYIHRKQGAWLVNVTKPTNYIELTASDKKSLDDQLDVMIQNKYTFINYNGLRRDTFKQLTDDFKKNIFDNATVIIDEAHNLISRIVNKIKKVSKYVQAPRGENAPLPIPLALQIYEFLLRAKNCRIVLLTGTPIINYPNEIGILFNILRGYIKTWSFTLDIETTKKMNKEIFREIFAKEKVLDYIDYVPSSKTLTVTRNPYGFENKITEKSGYKGVTNEKKERKDETGQKGIDERGVISDEEFIKKIVKTLKKNDINVLPNGTSFHTNTALPDTLDEFVNVFLDSVGNIHNIEKFKRRIIGLTSYFRSAQEELLPRYNKVTDFHVLKIPMSDYQFKVYEEARQEERTREKPKKPGAQKIDKNGLFIEPSSTYRIFSRLFCNFVMPKPPGRPKPQLMSKKQPQIQKGGDEEEEQDIIPQIEDVEIAFEQYKNEDAKNREVDELEGDEILDTFGGVQYKKEINDALQFLKKNKNSLLGPDGLEIYSPKFLTMLENIQDTQHPGLHLVYSQFRSMEGIGIFTLVLEANGFAQFKIRKTGIDGWQIDISEEDVGKPCYALYTGTEEADEREIIRNIYNGSWDNIPNNIAQELRRRSNNNNMGEIIKVFMITAAGSEGINLRNTRYVHIMEPYWHPVRVEQVIGRARRICSHQSLPISLQSVEVFLYLMTFTAKQLASDDAIELKLKDLSKRRPYIPLTSDENLFEISNIKEEVSSQLLQGIKEASIDCATHVKSSTKENLVCLSFGQPVVNEFSYHPNYAQDENDTVATLNRTTIHWEGREFKFNGKRMVLREETKQVYDYDSYMQAREVPGVRPILIGKLEQKNGTYRIIQS